MTNNDTTKTTAATKFNNDTADMVADGWLPAWVADAVKMPEPPAKPARKAYPTNGTDLMVALFGAEYATVDTATATDAELDASYLASRGGE